MQDALTLIKRKRRRRVLGVLGVLGAVPLLLASGALLFLQSSAGEALIKQKVLTAVGEALAGKVEAGHVQLHGNHVVLTDLKLFTPEGELVASVERVEADVELAGLTHQQLHLEDVKIQAPKLRLVEDERGWNLLRAVALKASPPSAAPPSGPTAWKLQFDGLDLADGLFDLEQEGRRITAAKLTAKGEAKIRLAPLEISGTLALSSALTAPLEEALVATVEASTTHGPQNYDVVVTLGGSRLRAHAELPTLAFTVDEVVAAPREVSAFLPAWPLKPTVYGKGTLSLGQAALELKAGRARVSLEAKYSLPDSSAQTLVVHGADVDFQELIGAPLPSSLAFDASGAIPDWRPATLRGALGATATWDATGGQRLASAQLTLAAEKGSLQLRQLEVLSPGLALRAHATASSTALSAFATLEAKDLGKLGQTLHTFANVDLAGLGGIGTVRVSLTGPLRKPAAKVCGEFNQFSLAGIGAEKVDLNADVPDISVPLDTAVVLFAQRLHFGERAFDQVTFDFLTHGRQLDVDLATKGLGDLRVHTLGLLDKDTRGAELQTLELTATDASWALEAPTHLGWGEGVTITPFSLRDGDQHLAGELMLTRTRLDAKLLVERLDLSKVPHALAPPSLELGGSLSADATVTGRPARPAVTVKAQLKQGRVKGFDALDAEVQASWLEERAKGSLTLSSSLGQLDGVFDVPVMAFLDQKPGEGTAHFSVKDVPTDKLENQLGRKLPAQGLLSGIVDLTGSGEHPKVRVTVESSELTIPAGEQTLSVRGAQLAAFTTDDGTLGATLRFDTLGSKNAFTLSTPLTLASLRRHPPTAQEWLTLPLTLQLDLQKLNLKQLDAQHFVSDDELAGAVSLTGTVKGSLKAPTGELELTLDEVTYPPLRKANAHLTLHTDASRTVIAGTATLAEQQQGLELTATISALPERALAPLLFPPAEASAGGEPADRVVDALRDVPLQILLVLQPLALSKVMPPHEGHIPPGGVLSATLEVGGTLQAPTARLVGTLQDLRFDRVTLGSARFDLKSSGTAQSYTIALGGQGQDDFKAKGTLGLDVRLSALRHGLDWRAAPVDVTLESRNFELGFLSGSTDLLRVVGGRLDFTGHLSGTLGAPHFLGDASLRGGRLALAGFGEYRDIALELHADDNRVDLKQLQVTSGAGSAQLVATAVRQPSGQFTLTSTGSTDKFSIVADDQLIANVSLRYVLAGDITAHLIDIHKLELPRVEVALPEVKRKDLQDLQRPRDIIVLRSGARATQRRRQEAKDAAAAAGVSPQPLVIRAILDAPRNVWVRSSDVNIELGLSDGFRVEFNDGLRLFGEVQVIKGTLEVIGREFTAQKGSEARFAGPPALPYVSVAALHVNTREQVKITVTVAGRGTDLGFKVSSEPPMPESDIYAVLATGRRTLKTSGGAAFTPGQAASVVGQLAASQLKTVIAKKLPIDVFNFETSDNFEKVKLDVGKYLSDTVYLGGAVDIGAKRERGENVWSGRIELQLTRSISLEAYAGDALSFGADAVWSRDF